MVFAFFVTKTEKLRIVYDGAAKVDGKLLDQVVLAGENLPNNLSQVLLRFCLDKYTCVADINKCFFQVGNPKNQHLFHIV